MNTIYWLTRRESDLPPDTRWLSPDEIEVVSGLTMPKRERDWLLGRWTAKQALAARAGPPGGRPTDRRNARHSSLARLEVRAAGDGAPEAFFDGEPLPLSVSISHVGGRALAAVHEGGAVGCDLEQIEARSELFVHDYFTQPEQDLVHARREPERPLYENLIWSAKESALKALRVGLKADTHTVEVDLPTAGIEHGWRRLTVRHTGSGETFAGWWRQDGGFVITFAAPPPHRVPEQLAAQETRA